MGLHKINLCLLYEMNDESVLIHLYLSSLICLTLMFRLIVVSNMKGYGLQALHNIIILVGMRFKPLLTAKIGSLM